MRNSSLRNSAKCLSHVGDISLSCVMCMMVALLMKNSSIGVKFTFCRVDSSNVCMSSFKYGSV